MFRFASIGIGFLSLLAGNAVSSGFNSPEKGGEWERPRDAEIEPLPLARLGITELTSMTSYPDAETGDRLREKFKGFAD